MKSLQLNQLKPTKSLKVYGNSMNKYITEEKTDKLEDKFSRKKTYI